MNEIEKHYNKHNEDKRLEHRHGIVEYTVSMKYIHDYLFDKNARIIDVGAGTGRYSIALSNEGYDVTAVELVKHNLNVINEKKSKVKAILGNALNLSKLPEHEYDLCIIFGPMYHLFSVEDKVEVLKNAKRVTKLGGIIMVAYLMNEYAVILHGVIDNYLSNSITNKKIDNSFHVKSEEKDIYEYVRLEDINYINELADIKRITIFSPDGPTDYIRKYVNNLNEKDFEMYIQYVESICERPELLGAGSHLVDVLQN